jgi:hypothetical protein
MSGKRFSRSGPPSSRRGGGAARGTVVGAAAVKSLITHAGDQVKRAVRNRYLGKNSMFNIARDVSTLMSVVNTEEKHQDNSISNTNVQLATSLVQVLNPPATGTSSQTRIGNSIKVNRIQFSMLFRYTSGTGTLYLNQNFKWYLVRWLKTPSSSGTTPFSIADFLEVDQASNYSTQSLADPDTIENFAVMAAGSVELNLPQGLGTDQSVSKVVDVDHACSFHQTFNSTTAASITDGCVFLVVVASSPSNTAGSSNISFTSRMMFIDN